MNADLILYNIGQLVTSKELENFEGSSMENIEVLRKAYVAIQDGIFIKIGTGELPKHLIGLNTQVIDTGGKVVTPGLIDSHTHLVHAGSREDEFSLKINGMTYMDILESGGGILNTVKATRAASVDELIIKAKESLDRMLSFGVTTIDSKSGYGLNLDTEKKQLEVNKILKTLHPVDIVSTFMGAHAVPEEFKDNPSAYIEEVIKMLHVVRENELAEFSDVFCEKGVFSVEDCEKILNESKKAGLRIKIHADKIETLGGAELAGMLNAVSASHLMSVSDNGIKALVENNVIANLLPGTSFYLRKEYAPARKMIDSGVQVALSTDYNPGSCPTENLQLIMQIAASHMKMSPKEVFKAVTINAAKAVGREGICGSIEVGKRADMVVFNASSIDFILYHFGINHTESVYKKGNLVYKK